MKIHKINIFEKLNIDPIYVKDLDSVPANTYTNAQKAVNDIIETLRKYCCYSGIDTNGNPANMGKLLELYGIDCKWRIRYKAFEVDKLKYYEKNKDEYYKIVVYWITQEFLNYDAAICLCKMFEEMMKKTSDITKSFDVLFCCGCRHNYTTYGNDPELTLYYDFKSKTVEIEQNNL